MSNSTVIVSDRFDNLRGELPGVAVNWSFLINGLGMATLQIGFDHPKATEYYLGMSNIARVKYPGLRTWIGRIDGLQWQAGAISVTCRSLECLLQKRRTAETRSFVSTAGGVCAKALVDEANDVEKTGALTSSDLIWSGGDPQTFTCYHDDVYERVQTLAETVGAEWWVDENRYLRWESRRGTDRELALIDGVNVSADSSYSEIAVDIANDWLVIGYGEDWAQKPKVQRTDGDSIGKYGLRQATEDAQDLPTEAALETRSQALVNEYGLPFQFFDLLVPNVGDIWSQLDLGDRVRLQSGSWGWNGIDEMVRIIGQEINDQAGVMRLIVKREV
jgi:hypothetical protein